MKNANRLLFLAAIMAASVVLLTFSACGDDDEPTPSNPNEEPVGPNKPDDSKPGTLLLLQTCSTCEGSTECQTCHGTGKGCPTCKGEGIHCDRCGTSGECTWCYGDGECKSCYGKGGEQCTWCMSKPGYCGKCVGTGQYGTARCTSCNGSGRCYYCKGNYWTKCSSCNGSGDCSHCYGRGTCPTCYGYPPTCTTCGGDGHCTVCENADGKCVACAGTGRMSIQALAFAESGGSAAVFVQSTEQWEAIADAPWIRLSRTSGIGDNTITVTADANSTATDRTGVITFTYGSLRTIVNVTQTGEDVRLSVEPTSIFINASGTGESITISSNTSWTISAADSWVTCSPSSGSGDATISVSASAYSASTRYTTLTITDATGEVSYEVSVAQAANREQLNQLKTWLEKPMGIIDVNMKTAGYYTVRNAIAQSYTLLLEQSGGSTTPDLYNMFSVTSSQNPSFNDLTYQGVPLYQFHYSWWKYFKSISYVFEIEQSKAPNGYRPYLDAMINDFKFSMGITLEKDDSYSRETYKGTDADGKEYSVSAGETSLWNGSAYVDGYAFSFGAYY